MLRTTLLIALFLAASAAQAAGPYCVSDVPDPRADTCVWDGTGFGALVNPVVVDTVRGVPANGNRVCLRDCGTALVGTNNITLSLRDSTNVWGDSVIVPFSFVRSAPPGAPTGMRVAR